LGTPAIRGIAYVPAHLIEAGINLSDKRTYMYAVSLSQEEIFIAMEYGTPRVMAMIGQQTIYYPYPLWSDRKRPNVVKDLDKQKLIQSILYKVPKISLLDCSICFQRNENKLLFKIPSSTAIKFKNYFNKLAPNSPVAFILEYDFSVNGHLVWTPSDPTQISAITPNTDTSGKALCGSFIVFCPEQTQNNISIVEDGFFGLLTNESWSLMRDYLMNAKKGSLKSQTTDGFELELMWLNEDFRNPVDGQVYVAPGGWKTYTSSSSTSTSENKAEENKIKPPIDLVGVVLLTPEQQIEASGLTAHLLSDFVKEMTTTVERELINLRKKNDSESSIFELHIQVQISPGSIATFTIKTVPDGKLELAEITSLEQSLSKLEIPSILRETVSFLLTFDAKIPL
jgi:hypothetical protein